MPTVLITGASRGIGLGLARSFAAAGWRVHGCCRRPDDATDLAAVVGDVSVHRLDVTDGERLAALARELAGEPIDVLLNNAGIYGPHGEFGTTSSEDWDEILAVNLRAPLRVVEHFVEHVAASRRRLVVNVSTVMASIGSMTNGGSYAYRASKAGLNAIAKALSIDLADRGIAVVAVHPGWVRTDMGGPDADIGLMESVDGLRTVIDGLGPDDAGRFLSWDGVELPW